MTPSRHVYVSCMGAVYRFTRQNWKRYLTATIDEQDQIPLDEYARELADFGPDITDLTPGDAADLLKAAP